MIELDGKFYKLCLIDTCVISELLKYKDTIGKYLVTKFLQEQRLFCYSIKNIEEIKNCKDIFDEFFEYSSIIPTIILKNDEMLLDEEISGYDDNQDIDPILLFISMLKDNDYYSQLKEIFNRSEFVEKFKSNDDLKTLVLNAMVKKSKNYPKGNVFLNKHYIENWLCEEMRNILFEINKEFMDNKIKLKEPINYDKFPSLKSMTLIRFYKFYLKHRKPKSSDVSDIYISSAFPYVDTVLLEKDMTNQIIQIQNKHHFYSNLEVLKLIEIIK